MPTLKVKNNGVWEKVAGGGSGGSGSELPTGGTAGQVLTVGSDGKYIWADPTGGGNLPAAEEVLF